MEGRTRTDIQPFSSLRRITDFSPLAAYFFLSRLLILNLICRRSTTMPPPTEYLCEYRNIFLFFSFLYGLSQRGRDGQGM
jgi:hypothetical protein